MAAPTEQEPIERVVERTRDSIQRAQLRSQEEAAQTQFATTHAVRMPWPDAERLCAAASKAAEFEEGYRASLRLALEASELAELQQRADKRKLDAAQAEVAELRAERDAEREHVGKLTRELDAKDRDLDRVRGTCDQLMVDSMRQSDELEKLRTRLTVAEAALRPFSDLATEIDGRPVYTGVDYVSCVMKRADLNAARAALAGEGGES